jgi:signal transduction histidine kinase
MLSFTLLTVRRAALRFDTNVSELATPLPSRSSYGPTTPDLSGALDTTRQRDLILAVEDDFLLRTSIAEFLASNGYDVVAAADGLEALIWLDSNKRQPSVILLDLTMPRMDGIRFLKLQKSRPRVANIPVIAITGTGQRRTNLAALGFSDVFFKPLDMSTVLKTIRNLSLRTLVTDSFTSAEARLERDRQARVDAEGRRADADLASREWTERLLSLCHALQTPLSVVLMRSELLLTRPGTPDSVGHGLRNICGAARMQAAIIDNVVEWSRMQEGAPELVPVSVDLASCVQDVLSRFAYQTGERKIATRLHLEPRNWTVMGDPARLTLAIHNLVGNAVKFTPSGGAVDVSLERTRTTASVRVSDTGAGFSPKDGAHLFEPLPMGDPDSPHGHRSLRLGLAVVRWIAQIHEGTISASSDGPSRGSSFVLTSPAIPEDEQPSR